MPRDPIKSRFDITQPSSTSLARILPSYLSYLAPCRISRHLNVQCLPPVPLHRLFLVQIRHTLLCGQLHARPTRNEGQSLVIRIRIAAPHSTPHKVFSNYYRHAECVRLCLSCWCFRPLSSFLLLGQACTSLVRITNCDILYILRTAWLT